MRWICLLLMNYALLNQCLYEDLAFECIFKHTKNALMCIIFCAQVCVILILKYIAFCVKFLEYNGHHHCHYIFNKKKVYSFFFVTVMYKIIT